MSRATTRIRRWSTRVPRITRFSLQCATRKSQRSSRLWGAVPRRRRRSSTSSGFGGPRQPRLLSQRYRPLRGSRRRRARWPTLRSSSVCGAPGWHSRPHGARLRHRRRDRQQQRQLRQQQYRRAIARACRRLLPSRARGRPSPSDLRGRFPPSSRRTSSLPHTPRSSRQRRPQGRRALRFRGRRRCHCPRWSGQQGPRPRLRPPRSAS
mmetsp:Transcript_11938/g.38414  ORF Transcript_11938/g.38414 Transcript_11938/m.38414 type:complete len:208 (+) Transcript_11938:92-715(+)